MAFELGDAGPQTSYFSAMALWYKMHYKTEMSLTNLCAGSSVDGGFWNSTFKRDVC